MDLVLNFKHFPSNPYVKICFLVKKNGMGRKKEYEGEQNKMGRKKWSLNLKYRGWILSCGKIWKIAVIILRATLLESIRLIYKKS